MKKLLFFCISLLLIQTGYSQTRILCLGESTTDFGPSYRRKMCELLTADGLNYDMVGPKNDGATTYDGDHAGYSGVPSSGVQYNMEQFYTSHPADIILIWEGTNDCGWASVGGTIVPLSDLVDKACQLYPNAKVLVASIPPMGYSAYESVEHGRLPGVAQANGVTYNNAMPGMVNTKFSEGKKVYYVDATSLTMSDITSDEIHPNQTGYDKMGVIFYNAVKTAITPINITSVTLPSTASISNVGTIALTATILPSNASNKTLTWSSSNTSVATVSASGLVTAVAIGTASITATANSDNTKVGTCALTVTAPAAVTSVSLPSSASVFAGATVTLTPTIAPSNALKTVNWSSSNTAIATVSASGIVTGVAVGTANITAISTTDASKSASTTVTVNAPPSKIEAETATLAGGAQTNNNHTGFTGTGFVDKMETIGASVAFSVYAVSAGSHDVTLRYCNSMGDTRTLSIYVNGTKIKQTTFASLADWDTWDNMVETLTLNAGNNTITYKYDSSDNGFVNIDFISVASNVSLPEIYLTGRNSEIASGNMVPNMLIGTNFSNRVVGTGFTRTYVINNTGAGTLNIGSITLSNAAYSVVSSPSSILPGQSAELLIRFSPSTTGAALCNVSIVTNDTDENPYTFAVTGTGISPEIVVRGRTVEIASGSTATIWSNHTDFSNVKVGESLSRSYALVNTGTSDLTVGAITFSNSAYTLTQAPTTTVWANGGETSFTVRYSPTATGTAACTISIANNDLNESPYTFALTGNGISPEIVVRGRTVEIASGSTATIWSNYTDFGNVNVGGNVSRSYALVNTGTSDLTVGAITFSNSAYTLTQAPATTVWANGGETSFTVRYSPTATGTAACTISIANNDQNESPYTFALTGNGVISGGMGATDKQSLQASPEAVKGVSIYPNPASEAFNVETGSSEAKITILTLEGKVIKTIQATSETTAINTGNWSAGVYIVQVQADNSTTIKKVVVVK